MSISVPKQNHWWKHGDTKRTAQPKAHTCFQSSGQSHKQSDKQWLVSLTCCTVNPVPRVRFPVETGWRICFCFYVAAAAAAAVVVVVVFLLLLLLLLLLVLVLVFSSSPVPSLQLCRHVRAFLGFVCTALTEIMLLRSLKIPRARFDKRRQNDRWRAKTKHRVHNSNRIFKIMIVNKRPTKMCLQKKKKKKQQQLIMVVAAFSGRRLSPSADFDYINVLALHLISHHFTVVSVLFCGLKKRITPKIRFLYLVLISSVRFNRSCIRNSWA